VVPGGGGEPPRGCPRRILSPVSEVLQGFAIRCSLSHNTLMLLDIETISELQCNAVEGSKVRNQQPPEQPPAALRAWTSITGDCTVFALAEPTFGEKSGCRRAASCRSFARPDRREVTNALECSNSVATAIQKTISGEGRQSMGLDNTSSRVSTRVDSIHIKHCGIMSLGI